MERTTTKTIDRKSYPRAALGRIFVAAPAIRQIIASTAFSLAFAAAAESVIIASKTLVAAGGAAGLAVTPAVQAPAVYTLQTRMTRIKNAKAARLPPETTFLTKRMKIIRLVKSD
ncbi:hypothetical protein THAOC_07151 [Thalassiosira oceanica]|uniref:Uncharacterized protein n=1 Tax=Thalassiosira oceanica TaxID=159749 RepID=K0T102_THAOC|nr:hypothetical protein THAOC_07151 [Thalassiosira oceanica]|eukprot:EJK71415.1 hypothetical protein THAOC_07151 [Thalassiosira oceanica]